MPYLLRCAIAIGVAVVTAATLVAKGEAPRSAVDPPAGDFRDVFDAALAGDARGLTLAVAGQVPGRSARQIVRVYLRGRKTGWARAPRLREPLNSGSSMTLVRGAEGSCLGYQAASGRSVLECLRGDHWRSLPRRGLPWRGARLATLTVLDGRLVALFRVGRPVGSRLIALVLRGRVWRIMARPLATHGAVAATGATAAPDGRLDVALADTARGTRLLWTLHDGRWHAHPQLDDTPAGPMPGGPVRLGARVYLPVNDAGDDPWRFSVRVLTGEHWSSPSKPLNRGAGNAQGIVELTGESVWAAWQQHDPAADGLFETAMYVQQIAPKPRAARLVWSGRSLGPGRVETVRALGGRWVLYTPKLTGRNALTVRVKRLGERD
jgi:hypothetical protein